MSEGPDIGGERIRSGEREDATIVDGIRGEINPSFGGVNPEPIPDNKKGEFLPLAYFPIDPEYAVPAGLTPSNEMGRPTVCNRPPLAPAAIGQPGTRAHAAAPAFAIRGSECRSRSDP